MKKSRFYQVLGLLLVLCVLLGGCGSKKSDSNGSQNPPGNQPENTLQFSLPDSYMDENGSYYALPAGKKVKFYILADADEEKTVKPLATFTGTTGESTFKYTLPETLKGLQCYIYAVIETKDPYELTDKTINEAMEAAGKGDILFGTILDDAKQAIQVTLDYNVTIGLNYIIGVGEGPAEKSIFFVLPDTYLVGDTPHPIPANKEIKIYSVYEIDENEIIHTDYTFTGTTGIDNRIRRTLPDFLDGATREFSAVIYLKESSFELDGKTAEEVIEAMTKGEILYGQTEEDYLLGDGVHIENFEFYGPIPNGVIKFEMPAQCVGTNTPIPSGKPVKFYALADTNEPLEADHVFEGTTGSSIIECELPSKLFDGEYYFFAVVLLEGDFDLQGISKEDLKDPIKNKEIMFGQARNEEGENILYTLENNLVVRGLQFIDSIPDSE